MQVPAGTVCPFLKDFNVGPPQDHKLLPIAPSGLFSFSAEYVQQVGDNTGLVTSIKVTSALLVDCVNNW